MLQTQTVDGTTLELLKDILAMPQLSKFALVGGTNLSLRLGHRLSIDLDLFTSEPFDTERLANDILTRFPNAEVASKSDIMLFMYVNDVKVDGSLILSLH